MVIKDADLKIRRLTASYIICLTTNNSHKLERMHEKALAVVIKHYALAGIISEKKGPARYVKLDGQ